MLLPVLAHMLSWLKHPSGHGNVMGLILGQATYPGCMFDTLSGQVWEATDHGGPRAWLWPLSTPSAFAEPQLRHPCSLCKLGAPWSRPELPTWVGDAEAALWVPLQSLNLPLHVTATAAETRRLGCLPLTGATKYSSRVSAWRACSHWGQRKGAGKCPGHSSASWGVRYKEERVWD